MKILLDVEFVNRFELVVGGVDFEVLHRRNAKLAGDERERLHQRSEMVKRLYEFGRGGPLDADDAEDGASDGGQRRGRRGKSWCGLLLFLGLVFGPALLGGGYFLSG